MKLLLKVLIGGLVLLGVAFGQEPKHAVVAQEPVAQSAVSTTQIVDLGHLLSDLNESPTTNATQEPSGEICASSTSRKPRTSSGVSGRFDMGMRREG